MLRLKTNLQPIRSIFDAVFISIWYSCFTVLPIITVDKYKTKTEKKKYCIYLTIYDWIKSFLKITMEGITIYENLENKINALYWPVENSICQVTAALGNLLLRNLTLTLSEIKKYCNR